MAPGSWLHRLAGALDDRRELAAQPGHRPPGARPGRSRAPRADGTIEAVRLAATPRATVGVQWHPEYDFATDAVSRNMFAAFGAAVRGRSDQALAAD